MAIKGLCPSWGKSYLDWIGPSLMRHQDCQEWVEGNRVGTLNEEMTSHPSNWKISIVKVKSLFP